MNSKPVFTVMHDDTFAFDTRWQMTSKDTSDIFGIIRDDATFLSTVDLLFSIGGFQYETCLFTAGDSEILDRYKTKEEATKGHIKFAKHYNLR